MIEADSLPTDRESLVRTLIPVANTLATDKLSNFIRMAWPIINPARPLVWGWHMDAICEHLEAITAGQIKKLVINVPPGHAKTSIISICWPCWEWLKNPQLRYLAASYSDDLAKRASKDRTDIIHSPWYQSLFLTVPFFKDPKNRWEVTHSTLKEIRTNKAGSMISTSIGGKATGMHGDRVLVDDPLKAQDVHTINLARHVEWFNQTMRTRVTSVKESAFVVVMQRLHQEDLAGVLIKDDEWDHLRLPSEFEPAKKTVTSIGWEDPRTEEGEPLFPERFPVEHLRHQKGPFGLGPIAYAAQHQQDPVSGEGNIFQRGWWKFWSDDPKVKADARLPDEVDRVIGSWDMTFKAGTDSDFVVGQVWAAKGADFYLLDQVRARLGFTETKHAFRSLAAEYPMVDRWLVEEKANGSAIISELKDEIGGVISVVPLETKAARAAAVSGFVEAGNVYLPSMDMINDGGAARFPWVFQLLDECLVGSTLVAAEHGDVPIRDVQVGDRVWTRSGWKFVLKADCTKKAARVFSVSIGDRKLVGTAGHPVWVNGRGFVPLIELKPGDEVLCLEGSMSSSIGGSSSGDTRTRTTPGCAGTTMDDGAIRGRRSSTGSSTKRRSARSRRAITSIIGTGTTSTIEPRTSSALTDPSTTAGITRRESPESTPARCAARSSRASTSSRRGCARSNAGTLRGASRRRSTRRPVKGAEPSIERRRSQAGIAGAGACKPPGPGPGSQRECVPARFVGSNSIPDRRRHAAANVVTSFAAEVGTEDVYNLHVEEAEEYFANGILVHNCSVFPSGAFDDQVDAMTQALRDLKEWVRSLHNLSLPPPLPPRRGQAKQDAVAGEAPVHRLQKQARNIIERERARMGKRRAFRASRDPNESGDEGE